MISEVPKAVATAISQAQEAVSKCRTYLAGVLKEPANLQRLDRQQVQDLYRLAVQSPQSAKLSELLAKLVPASLIGHSAAEQGLGANKKIDFRMLKLCAAVLEAGMAEQLSLDGLPRQGPGLSAQALENSLDEWMVKGRHRALFEDSPLSKIDTMIAMHDGAPVEHAAVIETRFGLLVPVIANVHLWRILEQLTPAEAGSIGWCEAHVGEYVPGGGLNAAVTVKNYG